MEAEDDIKYQRKCKQWNLLTETREPHEQVKATVKKGLRQELSADYSLFLPLPGSYRETNNVYVQSVGYLYKYRCICLLYLGNPDIPADEVFHSEDGEVLCHRWTDAPELKNLDVEFGARQVIAYYLELLHAKETAHWRELGK